MISIVTPVLNGYKFIEKNILSIKALSIPFEHIIVDGGSTDGTLSILEKYPHLKILHQEKNDGMYGAINQGFKIAMGEYFAYVNCDDYIITSNYEKLYNTLKRKGSDFIYSNGIFLNLDLGKETEFKSPKLLFSYFVKNGIMPFIQPSSIFSKKIFDLSGPFDSDNFKWAGDFDFFRKIILDTNYKISYLNLPTVYFMLHDNSLTQINLKRLNEEKTRNEIPIPSFLDVVIYKLIRLFKL